MSYRYNPLLPYGLDFVSDPYGPEGYVIASDDGSVKWRLTVDAAGHVVTTLVVATVLPHLTLEDGTGSLLLEDGTYLTFE